MPSSDYNSIPKILSLVEILQPKSILDIGCGYGKVMRLINKHMKVFSVGIDGWIECLTISKRESIYDDNVLCDIRFIPFIRKSFDAVLCLDVVEHLSKAEGLMLIKEMEEIATRQVIICTPAGFVQHGIAGNNPLQIHRSGWNPQEFRKMGYRVKGFGFRFIYGNRVPAPLAREYFSFILSCLLAPLPYFVPGIANSMVCIKNVDGTHKEGNHIRTG